MGIAPEEDPRAHCQSQIGYNTRYRHRNSHSARLCSSWSRRTTMILHHENGLLPGDMDLWPHQWLHERWKYPSLLFIGLEEPLRAGAQVVVESHSTLYLERKFGDPDYLQWSPILIDEYLTQDTCT